MVSSLAAMSSLGCVVRFAMIVSLGLIACGPPAGTPLHEALEEPRGSAEPTLATGESSASGVPGEGNEVAPSLDTVTSDASASTPNPEPVLEVQEAKDALAENEPTPSSTLASPERPSASGRWGMLGFEDPVGIELLEDEGVLRGSGCVVGAPGGASVEDFDRSFCSVLSGEVTDEGMRFVFSPPGYSAEKVLISEDGQRMTGLFGDRYTTWLRVEDDQSWIHYANIAGVDVEPLLARLYELSLVPATANGTRFSLNVPYTLMLTRSRGIIGDLGTFALSEIAPSTLLENVVRVGPVPFTRPELPVELELVTDGNGVQEVDARMESGDVYRFEVVGVR